MRLLENGKELESIWKAYPLQEYFSFPVRPYTQVVEFESEERLIHKDEKPEKLYFLFEGRAKVCLADDEGRISLISFTQEPCFLGEMEMIGAQERAQSVQAVTRCRCYAIDLEKCRERVLNDALFLRNLCLFMGRRFHRITENYVRNQAYPLENRLATFILYTMHHGMYTEKHTEVAEYLGVTYRHLLYVLADFRDRKILEKTPQGYKIVDLAALKAMEIH